MAEIVWYDDVTTRWLSINVYWQFFRISGNRYVQEINFALYFFLNGKFHFRCYIIELVQQVVYVCFALIVDNGYIIDVPEVAFNIVIN